MESKYYYRTEATEKVTDSYGQISSGDTIHRFEVKTLKRAMKVCDEWIKESNVYSVWIYKISNEDGCVEQWRKYCDDNKWNHTTHN